MPATVRSLPFARNCPQPGAKLVIGLAGDDVDGAGDGTRSVQRALWAAEYFDAFDVIERTALDAIEASSTARRRS